MRQVDTIVCIPLGPSDPMRHMMDTIESVRHYFRGSYRIVICDDSGKKRSDELAGAYPDLDVLDTQGPNGTRGGLFQVGAAAMIHAKAHYDFRVFMKIDTDALITGPAPDCEATSYFAKNASNVGLIGQWPNSDSGHPVARGRVGALSIAQLGRALVTPARPYAGFLLLRLYVLALLNGFKIGDHVLGGTLVFSRACVDAFFDKGVLPDRGLRTLGMMSEDHIWSLVTYAVGYRFGDFASGEMPVWCRWKSMPGSPEEVLRRGKKLIHSTRGWRDLNEDQVRAFFRQQRQQELLAH